METAGDSPSMKSTSGLSIWPRNCRAQADSDSTYRRWPSAKIVSKARLDLPEPDSPVNTIIASRGRSSETSLRLCSRAPRTTSRSATARSASWITGRIVAVGSDIFGPCHRPRENNQPAAVMPLPPLSAYLTTVGPGSGLVPIAAVDPDEAVVPRVVLGIVGRPVTAVPGKPRFEPEAGPLGDPERRRVARPDLQPDPGDAEAVACPPRDGPDAGRSDAAPSVLRPDPVRQLGAPWPVGHYSDGSEQPFPLQDADGELAACRAIPFRQRRRGIVWRIRPSRPRTPQRRRRFPTGRIDQQCRVVLDKDSQRLAATESRLDVRQHELYSRPCQAGRPPIYA